MITTVMTQTELDAALADDSVTTIDIRSERGVTIHVGGSATVHAWHKATVLAWDSATVLAWGSATVRAGSHTAVHLHSVDATVHGGVLIDHTSVDLTAARVWAAYHGVDIITLAGVEHMVVYKAVRDDLRSAYGSTYPIGGIVACDDFADTDACGAGLHFSPTPTQARLYDDDATRYLECHVRLDEWRPITSDSAAPKGKARRALVVREVDLNARPLADAAVA